MKLWIAALWVVTVVVAFGLGRALTPSGAGEPGGGMPGAVDPALVDSGDSPDRFAAALDERDPLERAHLFARSLKELGPDDVDEATAALAARQYNLGETDLRLFFLAWARFDAEGAFAWASAATARSSKRKLENTAMYAWAYRDPRGARQALEALDAERQRSLRSDFVQGWAHNGDIDGVTDFVFSLPKSELRPRFATNIVLAIKSRGLDALVQWAEAVPESGSGFDKDVAFRTAVVALVEADPPRAIRFFEAHQDRAYAPQAIKALATRWVDYHAPTDLIAWLLTLPPGKTRDDGMRAGFGRWFESDPPAATAWLVAADDDPALDPAMAVMASHESRVSATEGLAWAEKIHDSKMRQQVLIPILRRWAQDNPRAVRDWMAENDVPEEVREVIMRLPRYRAMEGRTTRAGGSGARAGAEGAED